MSDPQGCLVVLEGVDGSGKTTLSLALADAWQEAGVVFCSNKEINRTEPFAERIMTGVSELLWPAQHTTFDHLVSPHYWLSLQVAWYSLLSDFVVRPRLQRGETIIADGWYYKFMAKLLLRGFEQAFLEQVFAHVVKPDVLVLLAPSVADVWARHRNFRPHEMGLHQTRDHQQLGRSSFVEYQSSVFAALQQLARDDRWIIAPIDALAPIEHNVSVLRSLLVAAIPGDVPIG